MERFIPVGIVVQSASGLDQNQDGALRGRVHNKFILLRKIMRRSRKGDTTREYSWEIFLSQPPLFGQSNKKFCYQKYWAPPNFLNKVIK